jgi:hypothetical protein
MFSLQFGYTFHNSNGNNKRAITFEAGSGFDGGFFPDQTTGQYKKVQRDIYGGVVGLLLHAAN